MRVVGKPGRRLVRRVSQLFAGLALYGISMAFLVESGLGLDPWDVFHQGLSETTGISFGWVVILVGVPILLLWIPLRQRPGFGTLANLVVIGLVVDVALALLPAGGSWAARIAYLVTGIVLNGVATGMYIGSAFGPGPRDGLMTGLHQRTGAPVWLCRAGVEITVLAIGWLLGGLVGIGTVAEALLIGPMVHRTLPFFRTLYAGRAAAAALSAETRASA